MRQPLKAVLCLALSLVTFACAPQTQTVSPVPTSAPATAAGLPSKILPPGRIVLTDRDLPISNLYVLKLHDVVVYILPSGRKLRWVVEVDSFGSAEQTTASGLKGRIIEPRFDDLQDSGVSTYGNDTSIYYFHIDGYHVEWAEDLTADHGLPVVVQICKVGDAKEPDHEQMRKRFNTDVPAATGPALRVRISTIHYKLNQLFNFTIGLSTVDSDIEFDVFDEVAGLSEADRQHTLETLMQYVVDRYDHIDRISQFVINVKAGERPIARYVASKSAAGTWTLQKRQP